MKKYATIITILTLFNFLNLQFCFSKEIKTTKTEKGLEDSKPKNIIIMIADGMGIGSITAYYYLNTNASISKFKNIALMTTHAEGALVTDSAASGTAIATGFKTKNGYISKLPDGSNLETIMEIGKKKGKATGIVVTSSITHATPAAFYSHVSSRGNENEIAYFITNQTIDVFFGGGISFLTTTYIPKTSYQEESNQITNNSVNLLEIMKYFNYKIITNYDEFYSYNPLNYEKVISVLEPVHLPSAISGNRKVSLKEMTEKALNILSKNPNGFLLMIEGSQIDWEAHGNNAKGLLAEIDDFDKAVETVLNFAQKRNDTLVIVTSDHETGGVSVIGGVIGKHSVIRFSSKDHTAIMVPVFSFGPYSEKFRGIIDNTFIGKTVIEILSQN